MLCGLVRLHGRFVPTFCFHLQCVWYVTDTFTRRCQTSRCHTPEVQTRYLIWHQFDTLLKPCGYCVYHLYHSAIAGFAHTHTQCPMLLVALTINSSYIPEHLSPAGLLSTFANLLKATVSSVMSVCPTAWNNPSPTRRIFIKFDIRVFFSPRKSVEKLKFTENLTVLYNGFLPWWPMLVYDSIWLSSS